MKLIFGNLTFLCRHFDEGCEQTILMTDLFSSNLDLLNNVSHNRDFSFFFRGCPHPIPPCAKFRNVRKISPGHSNTMPLASEENVLK